MLVDGDPTKNIEDIRKISAVITRGYLTYPREIHQSMGIKPFVDQQPTLKQLQAVSASNPIGMNEGAMQRFFGAAKHD